MNVLASAKSSRTTSISQDLVKPIAGKKVRIQQGQAYGTSASKKSAKNASPGQWIPPGRPRIPGLRTAALDKSWLKILFEDFTRHCESCPDVLPATDYDSEELAYFLGRCLEEPRGE
jgi:hypothetical protein